jgi:hypothetical protein
LCEKRRFKSNLLLFSQLRVVCGEEENGESNGENSESVRSEVLFNTNMKIIAFMSLHKLVIKIEFLYSF